MPFAELTDARCYYELHGSGSPVLLIPGLGATCQIWSTAVAQLARSHTVVLMDNRDVGRSTSRRPPQTLADFAVDVVELMDHLQLDTAHLLGLSLGGIVAQRVAIDHPARVDRLVLMSCADRFGPYLREIARLLGQALRRFPPELFRKTIELLGTSPQFFDAHAEQIERNIASDCSPALSRSAIVRQLRCLDCHDAVSEHYRINAPTLVVAGENDMLVPACYGRQMAGQIAASQFLLVPNCGHNPLIERPDLVVPALLNFLRDPGQDAAGELDQLKVEATV